MARQISLNLNQPITGGRVKNLLNLKALGAAAIMGAGLLITGCNSAPELSQGDALKLIQADYDKAAPAGITIFVDDLGMRQGATAKLWDRTKIYPNKYWADFKLSDAGKKVVKLENGGDVIEWRPASADDKNYNVKMITLQANHLRAHDLGNIEDSVIPGVEHAKTASFTEGVDLAGVPDTLQQIAHNPGNRLSTKRHADFALVNGAWTVHGVQ
jgi:hypothetical protein